MIFRRVRMPFVLILLLHDNQSTGSSNQYPISNIQYPISNFIPTGLFIYIDSCYPCQGLNIHALVEEKIAGCIAVRKLGMNICEMKRLYIRTHYRGRGIGRMLAEKIIDEAIKRGYSTMMLDTLNNLKAAMVLYRSLGFKKREPYYHNPLPGVVYWELDLTI